MHKNHILEVSEGHRTKILNTIHEVINSNFRIRVTENDKEDVEQINDRNVHLYERYVGMDLFHKSGPLIGRVSGTIKIHDHGFDPEIPNETTIQIYPHQDFDTEDTKTLLMQMWDKLNEHSYDVEHEEKATYEAWVNNVYEERSLEEHINAQESFLENAHILSDIKHKDMTNIIEPINNNEINISVENPDCNVKDLLFFFFSKEHKKHMGMVIIREGKEPQVSIPEGPLDEMTYAIIMSQMNEIMEASVDFKIQQKIQLIKTDVQEAISM